MEAILSKYHDKLVRQGLCEKDAPLLGGLDADIVWNRHGAETTVLEEVIRGLNINSILFSRPAEPYRSILNWLAREAATGDCAIHPQDCEMRTFLHDIPVASLFEAGEIVKHLKKRKSVVVPDGGIVSFGTVSPEQAFITFSSVCFSSYVKFFTDYYYAVRRGEAVDSARAEIAARALSDYRSFMESYHATPSRKGPFRESAETVDAIIEAGRMTVESRMVDSFFGNISYRLGNTIFISQTGSSLDELEGHIDPCPIDGSSTAAITASSEFSAHKSVYHLTDKRSILHGHPKFCVIISMMCDRDDCPSRGRCHTACREKRFINDIPIVPGEVGTGPTGLCNTLPPSLTGRGSIVWGHGLFTTGALDFQDAFENLIGVERMCFDAYQESIRNVS